MEKPTTARFRYLPFVLIAALGLVWPVAGQGEGNLSALQSSSPAASPWAVSFYSKVRLIAAETALPAAAPSAMLGVQIVLKPGWKTYWRNPGDSGVPPQFSWDKSENIADIKIRWPAPVRLPDQYGVSIGYLDQVVFPIEITPRDPAAPMRVDLKLDYAACKDICYPLRAEMSLRLAPGIALRSSHARLIDAYLARVPRRERVPGGAVVTAVRPAEGGKPALLIDVKPGVGGDKLSLFVEGPRELFFGDATLVPGKPRGQTQYRVSVDGVSKTGALKGVKLRITLVAGMRASEQAAIVK